MKTHASILSAVALALILLLPGVALGTTYYVNQGGGEDFTDIQTALNTVAGGGLHTIIVRDGTYTGANNRDLDFGGKAVTLQSENGAANCIIDCEGSGRGFYFDSGEGYDSVVDGFQIINGAVFSGGGFFCNNSSSPTISNCIISGSTVNSGGGIHCTDFSSPIISNCLIDNNSTQYEGGGITCDVSSPTITGCTISNNSTGGNCGGIYCRFSSSPIITDCIIRGNTADMTTGGILCEEYSSPDIINCTISQNSAILRHGGIYVEDSSPNIINCIITENSAGEFGGGMTCRGTLLPPPIVSPNIINCTISGNSADTGGGIYCLRNATPTITNSILWGNSATINGPEIALIEDPTYPSTLTVRYSDVEGGQGAASVGAGCTLNWGIGNIDPVGADPLFVNPPDFVDWTTGAGTTTTVEVADATIYAGSDVIEIDSDGITRTVSSAVGTTVTFAPALSGASVADRVIRNFGIGGSISDDYHLRACSPGIDAGDPASDYSNEPYPNGANINMGAYGNTSEATRAGCNYDAFFASAPDIDGNGTDELVFLGENPSNQKVLAQVWDAETAIRTKNVWYGPVFKPIGVAVVPDINGNGKSEICLLGRNPLNNKVLGHVRDGATGTYLRYVWFGAKQAPVGLKVMEDISGNGKSELVMIARDPDNNKGVAKVYDSSTGSMVKLVWYGPVFDTLGLEIISDSNGNGRPDIVQMALNPTNRKVLAHIRDSLTGVWIRYLWFGTQYYPIDLKTVPDVNGNGYDELALLGVDYNTGEVVVKVMDSYTRATLRIRTYFTGYTPIALEVLPDMNGGGRPELAVLAVDPSDGTVYVSIKDSRSGEVVADNSFGSTHEPWGIGMGERYQRRRQA